MTRKLISLETKTLVLRRLDTRERQCDIGIALKFTLRPLRARFISKYNHDDFCNKNYSFQKQCVCGNEKTQKVSYSLFFITYRHYLSVKITAFNALSFSAETYCNVSPALSRVVLYLYLKFFIPIHIYNTYMYIK